MNHVQIPVAVTDVDGQLPGRGGVTRSVPGSGADTWISSASEARQLGPGSHDPEPGELDIGYSRQ